MPLGPNPPKLRLRIYALARNPHWADPRRRSSLGFFAAKGFVEGNFWYSSYRADLTLPGVLWTCQTIAPELYEVVPAAVLRFPTHLAGPRPEDLTCVCAALEHGDEIGPDYKTHEYTKVRRWLDGRTKDARTAECLVRPQTFRLPATLMARVRARARETNCTMTQVLIEALERHL